MEGPGADRARGEVRGVLLAVDDDPDICTLLRLQLGLRGFVVHTLGSGVGAVSTAFETGAELVLLDIDMPDVDGFEVLRRLKADPRTAALPVLFLSARSLSRDVADGLRLGAHDYLRKPFAADELDARVSAALKAQRVQRELARRNDELEVTARTDPLTGLWNRRHVEERLAELRAAGFPDGVEHAVLMIDVDQFKEVNDVHGHAAGDLVLRGVADCLRASVRPDDLVGRLGGDELVVVLPDTTRANAVDAAERICAAVRAMPVRLDAPAPVAVTVSVGVGMLTTSGDDALAVADRALYEAKAAGRAQARVAS